MGGNKRNAKKSSFSVFNIFKSRQKIKKVEDEINEDDHDYVNKAYRVFPSDEDRDRWVAKPGIDNIATSYIDTITKEWTRLAFSNDAITPV